MENLSADPGEQLRTRGSGRISGRKCEFKLIPLAGLGACGETPVLPLGMGVLAGVE